MKEMQSCEFEQLVALYVEGDLSAAECNRVEAHLRECSSCWDLAEDLKESQDVFKSIRQDVPDAAALSAVRERVLSEVTGARRMPWFARWVFASVALAMVGIGAWRLATPQAVIGPPEPLRRIVVPPAVAELAVAPSGKAEVKRVRASRPTQKPDETKQVTLTFVTDDPDIIIYWLVDEKGD
jgi:anti-sigma factor RsiW